MLSLSVVAATVILLAHAITKDRQPVPTANAGVPGALAREGKPAGKWESAQWPPADRGSGQAGSAGKSASAGSGATSDLMASLGAAAADNEAVFVLLPGEDRSRTEAARRAVNTAVAKVRARGRRAAALTLTSGNPKRASLAARLGISKFPSVVVQGQGCGETVMPSGITEEKLLQAFVAAAQPSSSCGTSSTCGSCETN